MTATITVLADYKRQRVIIHDKLMAWRIAQATRLAFLPAITALTWWGTYYRTFADVARIRQ